MKERVILFFKTYLLFVCLFVLQKPLFMGYYHASYGDAAWSDWLAVMWHGLPLDFSLAGYLTVIPGLLLITTVWALSAGLHRCCQAYFGIVSLLLSLIFVVDMGLYDFWGFRLDATPLFYFFSSPKDAFASVSGWFIAVGVIAFVVYAALLYGLFRQFLFRKHRFLQMKLPYRRLRTSFLLLLLTALLFIPIRGGFTVSTMNTGKVYFSSNMLLNHAATNPAFNLMESLSKQKDFARQYRFLEPEEADRIFRTLVDPSVLGEQQLHADADSAHTLFTTRRPDVLIVILESFSSHLMTVLGGEPGIAVQLDSLAQEGVLFTNFHANSFRTDRGLVAVLSGYPAQPTTSIMKYPRKTQHLPAIARSLKEAGYSTDYYYGGDADFTNMRSYLMASGFDCIISDRDFPVGERLSKWGVHDHLVFRRLLEDLRNEAEGYDDTDAGHRPAYRVLQTSSSHEPFEVPYRRLENDRQNAFAYTDSCAGDFIRQFRELPQWKNSVVIFVPDHQGAWPENLNNFMVERYKIPLLMVGGAVRRPLRVDTYGSQQDIAATLLAQLGLPHDEFTFSKDLFNPAAPHFAFFTVPDAFGMVTPGNQLIFDNQAAAVVLDEGGEQGANLLRGKAYLQKLYDDLAAR